MDSYSAKLLDVPTHFGLFVRYFFSQAANTVNHIAPKKKHIGFEDIEYLSALFGFGTNAERFCKEGTSTYLSQVRQHMNGQPLSTIYETLSNERLPASELFWYGLKTADGVVVEGFLDGTDTDEEVRLDALTKGYALAKKLSTSPQFSLNHPIQIPDHLKADFVWSTVFEARRKILEAESLEGICFEGSSSSVLITDPAALEEMQQTLRRPYLN